VLVSYCPMGHERDDEGMCECDCTVPMLGEGHPADDPRHLTSDRIGFPVVDW